MDFNFSSVLISIIICIAFVESSLGHGRAVAIATGYGLDDRAIGVRVPVES
jgi:hypothetical protein